MQNKKIIKKLNINYNTSASADVNLPDFKAIEANEDVLTGEQLQLSQNSLGKKINEIIDGHEINENRIDKLEGSPNFSLSSLDIDKLKQTLVFTQSEKDTLQILKDRLDNNTLGGKGVDTIPIWTTFDGMRSDSKNHEKLFLIEDMEGNHDFKQGESVIAYLKDDSADGFKLFRTWEEVRNYIDSQIVLIYNKILLIEGRIYALETKVDDKADKSEITGLDAKISKNTTDITTNATAINSKADVNITTNAIALKADKSTVTDLETQINNLKDQVSNVKNTWIPSAQMGEVAISSNEFDLSALKTPDDKGVMQPGGTKGPFDFTAGKAISVSLRVSSNIFQDYELIIGNASKDVSIGTDTNEKHFGINIEADTGKLVIDPGTGVTGLEHLSLYRVDEGVPITADAVDAYTKKVIDDKIYAEHKYVSDNFKSNTDFTTLETKVNTKADSSALTAGLATKADTTALTAVEAKVTTNTNSINDLKSDKADTTYVDAELAKKAPLNVADDKADKTDVYDRTFLDTELGKKMNSADAITATQINTALALKGDKTAVDKNTSDIAKKADKDWAIQQLDTKADDGATTTALAGKANKGESYTKAEADGLLGNKADKSVVNSMYTNSQIDTKLNAKLSSSDLTAYARKDATYSRTEADALLKTKADESEVVLQRDRLSLIEGQIAQLENTWTGSDSIIPDATFANKQGTWNLAKNSGSTGAFEFISGKRVYVQLSHGTGDDEVNKIYDLKVGSSAVTEVMGRATFKLAVDTNGILSITEFVGGGKNIADIKLTEIEQSGAITANAVNAYTKQETDAKLATKQDVLDSTQLANIKLDHSAYLKTHQDISYKADTTYVNSENQKQNVEITKNAEAIKLKTDKSYVDIQLTNKVNTSDLTSALSDKADTTALALKLDSATYNTDKQTFALKTQIVADDTTWKTSKQDALTTDQKEVISATPFTQVEKTKLGTLTADDTSWKTSKQDVLTDAQKLIINANPFTNAEKTKLSNAITSHQDIGGKLDASVYNTDKKTFETIVGASSKYQLKGNYLTAHQDISGKLDTSTYNADKTTFETITGAAGKYQPKGTYITAHQDISGKLDTATYNTDKATFALKTALANLLKTDLSNIDDAAFNAKLAAAGITANKLGHFHGALATAPTTGMAAGDTYINTGDHKLYYYDGTSWNASSQTITKDTMVSTLGITEADLTKIKNIDQVFTQAEKTKLSNAITDVSGKVDTTTLTTELGKKQNNLSPEQLTVINAKPYTQAEKTKVASIDQTYTQAEKTKLAGLPASIPADDVTWKTSKQDSLSNSQLSVINAKQYTQAEKTKLAGLPASIPADDVTWKTSKQNALTADQIAVTNGEVFTQDEKTKLAATMTEVEARTDFATKATLSKDMQAIQGLLNGKQATLTQDQLTVVNANSFTDDEKSKLSRLTVDDVTWKTSKQDKLSQAQLTVVNSNPFTNADKTKLGQTITAHQDISGKANVGASYTKTESDNKYATQSALTTKLDANTYTHDKPTFALKDATNTALADKLDTSALASEIAKLGLATGILNEFKGVLPSAPTGTHQDLDWYINDTSYTIEVWHDNKWNHIGAATAIDKATILNTLGITTADVSRIKQIDQVFTQAEKTKLAATMTEVEARTDFATKATLSKDMQAIQGLLNNKQNTLTDSQKAVINSNPFTDTEKNKLGNLADSFSVKDVRDKTSQKKLYDAIAKGGSYIVNVIPSSFTGAAGTQAYPLLGQCVLKDSTHAIVIGFLPNMTESAGVIQPTQAIIYKAEAGEHVGGVKIYGDSTKINTDVPTNDFDAANKKYVDQKIVSLATDGSGIMTTAAADLKFETKSAANTSHADLTTKINTKADTGASYTKAESDSKYELGTHAASTYQVKGDYATNTALTNGLDGKVSKADYTADKQTFELKAHAAQSYATKTEVANKLTTSNLKVELGKIGVSTDVLGKFKGVSDTAPTGIHTDLEWYINSATSTMEVWHDGKWNSIGKTTTIDKTAIITKLGLTDTDLTRIKAIDQTFTQAEKTKLSRAITSHQSLSGKADVGASYLKWETDYKYATKTALNAKASGALKVQYNSSYKYNLSIMDGSTDGRTLTSKQYVDTKITNSSPNKLLRLVFDNDSLMDIKVG